MTSWLTKRAEEAAEELRTKPGMAGIHPEDVAEAIAKVAREFAERTATIIVNGRGENEGWALDIWGGDPDRDPERFVVTGAIAAAERET